MADATFEAVTRTEFGKGSARRARREGMIPAVVYGHGTDPVHIAIPAHQTFLVLRGSSNALFELKIDGKSILALPKDVQRDPVQYTIEHIDFVIVNKGEKVEVEVPVHVSGESYPGTIVQVELQTIRLEAEATNLPESVIVSVEGLHAGTSIHTRDLVLPEGSVLAEADDLLVINVFEPRAAEAGVDEAAEEA